MASVIEDRRARGFQHHPRAVELLRVMAALDVDGAVDLRFGGDGDNGEAMAALLSEVLEREEAAEAEVSGDGRVVAADEPGPAALWLALQQARGRLRRPLPPGRAAQALAKAVGDVLAGLCEIERTDVTSPERVRARLRADVADAVLYAVHLGVVSYGAGLVSALRGAPSEEVDDPDRPAPHRCSECDEELDDGLVSEIGLGYAAMVERQFQYQRSRADRLAAMLTDAERDLGRITGALGVAPFDPGDPAARANAIGLAVARADLTRAAGATRAMEVGAEVDGHSLAVLWAETAGVVDAGAQIASLCVQLAGFPLVDDREDDDATPRHRWILATGPWDALRGYKRAIDDAGATTPRDAAAVISGGPGAILVDRGLASSESECADDDETAVAEVELELSEAALAALDADEDSDQRWALGGGSDGFWYDLTDGGYFKPDVVLTPRSAARVRAALATLRALEVIYAELTPEL